MQPIVCKVLSRPNIMSTYLVHFSLCLLLKGDFPKDEFSLIYCLTMGSDPLDGVAHWSVFKLNDFQSFKG